MLINDYNMTLVYGFLLF